jgi:putative membrane protein
VQIHNSLDGALRRLSLEYDNNSTTSLGAVMRIESKTSKIIYVSCLTIFLTGLGSWAVLAHQDVTAPSKADMADAHFAKAAAQGGMAEIQLGKLAADRGSNAMVKAFGERMVTQHGAAADQLKAAAEQAHIVLPTAVSSKDQQTYDRLARLTGSDFDRAYADDMVQDHEKDVHEFQNEANNGKNSGIRAFAAQTTPMIQQHLNQAREMQKAVSQTSSNRRVPTRAAGR